LQALEQDLLEAAELGFGGPAVGCDRGAERDQALRLKSEPFLTHAVEALDQQAGGNE